MFTQPEIEYLNAQPLARMATVSSQQQPDVAAVGFDFDGEYFYVSGMRNQRTLKYKNVAAGNDKVSLVVDDLASRDPWQPRGIKIHGSADLVERKGYAGEKQYLRIKPERKWSWGIEKPVFTN
ncbi:MAG: PPOX class F420-dependent oxidoreductase [Chloroflexi bacterium]|nr:MAG: PPOX class F420-dependent oxidoreductase [Chloroflexota bacterium]MBL1197344.1 PPOX class F420-dependent oxidoreductase [Chloroflexota bacterium]NOH14641.1 PPOX class F420-dependent oxidoreductase [Chloroflexota bacterium]